MSQSELNRLLILPAIVLAAALSLSGCAALPFFGGDSGQSNNSSSRDDDDEDDDDEDEDEDDDVVELSSDCPQEFLDATKETSSSSVDFDSLTVREISPSDFEPSSISEFLDGGCVLVVDYSQDDVDGTIYEAFIPGGQEVIDGIDAALVDDGFDDSTDNFYVGDGNEYVIVYSNEDSGVSQDTIAEQGGSFLGDEFVIVTAYSGKV
jgi:hypothetical protein